jgi:hypothetical protein
MSHPTWGVLLLGLGLLSPVPAAAQTAAPPPRAAIDHLILGIRSLDEGIREFAALTGVTPVRGGAHPGAGTENALVSLGDGAYLELIAAQPGATPSSFGGLLGLTRLTPVGWALRTDSMTSTIALLRATDSVLGPFPGSRKTPSGALLTWRTAHPAGPGLEEAPFLIEWGAGTPHPATTSPGGCRLVSLEVGVPEPNALNRMLERLGVPVAAQPSPRRMRMTLACPRGSVSFSS